MEIFQLGREMTKGTYRRGLHNSHKNLMALRNVQQFWRVWQCVGDTLPQIWLVSFCWCIPGPLPEIWLICPLVLFLPFIFTVFFLIIVLISYF